MNVTTKPLHTLSPVSLPGSSGLKPPDVQVGGFLDAMKQALATTSQLQSESGRLSREVTFGNPTVSLEETMFAGVKSNIAFQATLQSRNRIVQAYTDVMNMQV
ncbi:flagellar hook-basal body complex protein FliE [Acidovorax sp. LjRoot194]|uniref:flagellar hook-basal body complex protein FliE n=1 Tax=Acidovorax sp. LjRoot194 TaxID=3342280 RepID=UPI003ED038D2